MKLKAPSKQALLGTLLSTLLLGLAPIAQADPTPGYLSDYQYQVATVSTLEEAQSIMDLEVTETRLKSICANRAEVWTYMMNRKRGIQVGKVFIHFTQLGEADESKEWAYHVAPYIIVNGEEMVLDNGFGHFEGKPAAMKDWEKYFGKSENCVVLDPTHNPEHLALEQNNLPNDWVTPLTYKSGAARQYPTTFGICYIRKTFTLPT